MKIQFTYPNDVNLDANGLLDAGRYEDLLRVGGVDRRAECRSTSVARSHSLQ